MVCRQKTVQQKLTPKQLADLTQQNKTPTIFYPVKRECFCNKYGICTKVSYTQTGFTGKSLTLEQEHLDDGRVVTRLISTTDALCSYDKCKELLHAMETLYECQQESLRKLQKMGQKS